MEHPPPRSKRKPEPSARERALTLLARREHTRCELAAKLAPHVEEPAALQALLDDLTVRGWLSEARVVDQVVHAKRGRLGPARIRRALLERGVPEELIAPALKKLNETEITQARSVWARKFRTPPDDGAGQARQVRFLQSRGFSVEVAMRVVRRGGGGNESDSGD